MSKGSRREREAVDIYQRAGYATYRPATVRFGENDIFGLFDLLAVSPSHGSVRAVQVKSNRAVGIEDWTRHTALWRRLGWITEYAVPVDNGGWRLIACINSSCESIQTIDVVDEREMDCTMGEGLVEYLRECSGGSPSSGEEDHPHGGETA